MLSEPGADYADIIERAAYMAVGEPTAIEDYTVQARDFLAKARRYLAEGDLHQASEKGWGAAAHMAKAVALAQGWSYDTHAEFGVVLTQAWRATGNDRIAELKGFPNILHGNYYRRKRHLDADELGFDVARVAELLDVLGPLVDDEHVS